jgi:hypothetical protein
MIILRISSQKLLTSYYLEQTFPDEKDKPIVDKYTMALQSGRFMETVGGSHPPCHIPRELNPLTTAGWLSKAIFYLYSTICLTIQLTLGVKLPSTKSATEQPTFSRRYLDTNTVTYEVETVPLLTIPLS